MNTTYIKIVTTAIRLAAVGHNDSNHKYGDASYTVHLSHVVDVCQRFLWLVQKKHWAIIIAACWLHDSIEDARLSYNDVRKAFIKVGVDEESATMIAELARVVTNYGRGRNRAERMPDFIYEEIAALEFGTFVKLCDRIANVEAGGKSDMYAGEQEHFRKMLYDKRWNEMFEYLESLFVNEEN